MKRAGCVLLGMLALLSSGNGSLHASEDQDKNKDKEKRKDTELCFNLLCTYKLDPKAFVHATHVATSPVYKKCFAAARFVKEVDKNGLEIEDKSEHPDNPEFQVRCDDDVIFNNSAHRFTDHQGTRIQALSGPYPAVTLPRSALKAGHRYVSSGLELEGQTLRGVCYIYTGEP